MRVAICGGGSVAITAAAVLAARPDFDVTVLTRQSANWADVLTIHFGDDLRLIGKVRVTNDPTCAVETSEWVLLAVPAYARGDILEKIRPHLATGAWVGCIGSAIGFDWLASRMLPRDARYFALRRTPWIARTVERGSLVHVTAVRPHVDVAAHPSSELTALAPALSDAFGIDFRQGKNFLALTLGFDNATLHPPRLYTLFSTADSVTASDRFYGSWDDAASDCLLSLDDELSRIRTAFDISNDISARTHFSVKSSAELTALVRSMSALEHITVPALASGYPDLESRFFQEDFRFGLAIHGEIGRLAGVNTPTLNKIISWAESLLGISLSYGRSHSFDPRSHPPFPQSFGLCSADALRASTTC
ncbi:NAD/NADP octopine/nopaline dehydrogenase family protein [Paraburkholderia caribensis]|uniref:NAD/NADP octopine/nopaline dehydrogenase family protein n=1 Tax=Paraburkholderia caribensis TaxID=75105 RepID=UPI0009EA959D|nr:NAD/NADP octopine/nopaline dehydrogenase family protein [Paraburkholderia caribensis]AUT58006.1 hypothetical protein C2L66_39850 [Paraburkholderia caribensis]